MAPIQQETVEDYLKDVIADLYEIQSATHGYLGPETQQVLIEKISQLANSLSSLSAAATSPSTSSSDGLSSTIIPPDIIAYVEEGRNPDIYTREFVELVQRRNVYLRGKIEAFKGFAGVLEEEMLAVGVPVTESQRTESEGGGGAAAGGRATTTGVDMEKGTGGKITVTVKNEGDTGNAEAG